MKTKVIVHGVAGDEARARGILRTLVPLMFSLPLFGLSVGLMLPRLGTAPAAIGLLCTAALLTWAILHGNTSLRSFFKGAHGEDYVAFVLAGLPAGYHVFHAFPCGPADIDHVIVGPYGIFAVETKYWAGSVTASPDGAILADGVAPSRPPLEQATASAVALNSLLAEKLEDAPQSHPVLCFAGDDTFEPGVKQLGMVTVCNSSELVSIATSGADHLSDAVIERIVKVFEQNME